MSPRPLLALGIILGFAGLVLGQSEVQDLPAHIVPARPPTQQEANRRAALKQYVLGLLCEREDKLFEALLAFEEAVKLDPEAAAAFKAQVPILLSLDLGNQALTCCKKALDLDPGDHESWYVQARIYKALAQPKDARLSLERGLKTESLKEHPELAQQMYFDLGDLLEAEKAFAPAAQAFLASAKILDRPDRLTELGPFDKEAIVRRGGEVFERIGHLYRKAGRANEAVDAYHQALDRHPKLASRISYHLAQLYVEQGEPAKALPQIDAYLRFQPQGMEAYELKIQLLGKLGRPAAVLPWLEQAMEADPHNIGLRLLLAGQYARANRNDQAERIYLDQAERAPSPEVYRGLFNLYRQSRPAGLVDVLDLLNRTFDQAAGKENDLLPGPAAGKARAMIAVVRDDNDLALEVLKLGLARIDFGKDDLKYETVRFLAALADRHRKNDEAEKYYRAALARARPGNEALIYSGLLRALWKSAKYQAIVAVCDDGLSTSQGTNKILFLNEKAKALARLDRYEDALAVANQAVEQAADTERLGVRHMRVRVMLLSEKYQDAERECLALLKEYQRPGESMEIQYLLSNVYSSAKQHAKAEEQLEKILRTDPSNATANNDLGYLWADKGRNLKEAEEMIRRAIDSDRRNRQTNPNLTPDDDKDNAAYLDSFGWVLFRRGKLDEARQELERASLLPDGNDPVIFDHLGDVLHRLGQLDQARAAWRKAIELYEQEKRRKMDERYEEVVRKLKM